MDGLERMEGIYVDMRAGRRGGSDQQAGVPRIQPLQLAAEPSIDRLATLREQK